MKTKTIQIITAAVSTGVVAGLASMKVTDSSVTGLAVTVAYLAVASLIAIAASDYRTGVKAYRSALK